MFCQLFYIYTRKVCCHCVVYDANDKYIHTSLYLSSLYKDKRKHWTCQMLVRYTLSSPCLRRILFSPLSCMQCVELCVTSLPISLLMILRIEILRGIIITESKIVSVGHCIGLGNKSVMHCMFYVRI